MRSKFRIYSLEWLNLRPIEIISVRRQSNYVYWRQSTKASIRRKNCFIVKKHVYGSIQKASLEKQAQRLQPPSAVYKVTPIGSSNVTTQGNLFSSYPDLITSKRKKNV